MFNPNVQACVIRDVSPPHSQESAQDIRVSIQAPGGASVEPPASNGFRTTSPFSVCQIRTLHVNWSHCLMHFLEGQQSFYPSNPLPIFGVYEQPYFLQQDEEKERKKGRKLRSQLQMPIFFPSLNRKTTTI